jgi:hypothetical protein
MFASADNLTTDQRIFAPFTVDTYREFQSWLIRRTPQREIAPKRPGKKQSSGSTGIKNTHSLNTGTRL